MSTGDFDILNFQEKNLGGTHAFRSNLFAAAPTKRISTTIVAAIQSAKKLIFLVHF
jgi:hypothetical protein